MLAQWSKSNGSMSRLPVCFTTEHPSSRLRQLYPVLQQCAHSPHADSTNPEAVQVIPRVSLFDQKVHIRVHGLPRKAKVTLFAKSQQEWRKKPVEFMSCSHFVTCSDGELDLNRDASVGGTYTGLDPMGLFWSLRPSPAGAQNIRMVVRNGDDPILYTLAVYLGHLSLSDLASADILQKAVCSTTVTRLKRSADVRRIPIREGNIRGTLFLPPGSGPHPGVIDMFGFAGGLMEIRAGLLASHGFATLALAFFRYDDLPPTLEEVRFDYFEEAALWFSSLDVVKAGGIAVVGVSTGAVFGLLLAQLCPQVKALVRINCSPFVSGYDLYRNDGSLQKKCAKFDSRMAQHTENGMILRDCYAPATVDDIIPAWESSTHILTILSGDDQQLDPKLDDAFQKMYPADKRHLTEVVHYPGAGHLLEPPYSPHCRSCVTPSLGMDFMWGGNPVDHAAAQEDAWNRTLAFLKKHLR